MSRLIALIVLCGMSISVLGWPHLVNCIFDWEYFATQGNTDSIVLDYSGQHLTTLTEGRKTYHYVVGPVNTKAVVDDSYLVFYEIQKYAFGREQQILLDVKDACYFLENIYPDYLLPIGGTHNNFAPQESICPQMMGTTYIYPANSSEELKAPSKLDNGKYYLFVSFLKDNQPVGGISGNLTVLRNFF